MDKEEFKEIMGELNAAYGDFKFPVSPKVMSVWNAYIGSCDYKTVKDEVREYVETHTTPPTIADILRKIKEDEQRRTEEINNSYQIMIGYCASTDTITATRFAEICRGNDELSRFLRRYVAKYAHSTDFGIKKTELECLLEKGVMAWDTLPRNA